MTRIRLRKEDANIAAFCSLKVKMVFLHSILHIWFPSHNLNHMPYVIAHMFQLSIVILNHLLLHSCPLLFASENHFLKKSETHLHSANLNPKSKKPKLLYNVRSRQHLWLELRSSQKSTRDIWTWSSMCLMQNDNNTLLTYSNLRYLRKATPCKFNNRFSFIWYRCCSCAMFCCTWNILRKEPLFS